MAITDSKYFKHRMIFYAMVLLIGWCVTPVYSLTDDEENNIDVYQKAAKGVVNITSIVIERDFFYGFVPREGSGSGAVIDSRGYVLTNNHVIKDARRIEVTLADGSKWPGRLIGTDPDNDLAIVQIKAPSDRLSPLILGTSNDLKVGQKVLAIGNPFGLNETLTTGIISSIGRSIRSQNGAIMEDLIQTDASINPGNSGGPLLDSKGNVIGINTAIFSPSGGSVGIGFAIPVDTAKRIIPDLIDKGYVSHPWIGVSLFPLVPGIAKALDLKVDRGVLIAEIIPNGPADKAGLKGSNQTLQVGNLLLPAGGDVVVAFDGADLTGSEDFIRKIRQHRPGDHVKLKILRKGSFLEKTVILGEQPPNL